MVNSRDSHSSSGVRPPRLGAEAERRLLDSANPSLQAGLALYRWWHGASSRNEFRERFEETFVFNRPETSFGFFDQATVGGETIPVMGNFQTVDYDRSKAPPGARGAAADWLQAQVREFVLRYFLRVSDFREPEAYAPADRPSRGPVLDALSLCRVGNPAEEGFGFSQLYYGLRGSDQPGRFPESERTAITDLRDVGPLYDWVILWVRIFDFQFRVAPFGPNTPELRLPLRTSSFLVMNRELVVIDDRPSAQDELGRYGLGYAFIPNPEQTALGYGPGEFTAACEFIEFIVYKDGRVRVELAFISNVPDRILNVSADPFSWTAKAWDASCRRLGLETLAVGGQLSRLSPWRDRTFDPVFGLVRAANLFTDGRAERDLCVSQKQLLKEFLLKHFEQHYHTITGSLRTWRQIPDWTDTAALPEWVVSGRSA